MEFDHSLTQSSHKSSKRIMIAYWLGIIGCGAWLLPIIGLPIQLIGLVMALTSNHPRSRRTHMTILLCGIGIILSLLNALLGAYLMMLWFGKIS